ncbi:MAG: CDP-alcohol phosphatidyltransferase family protein [Planctomycetaceae bacterium]|nr:CDP-alcohol phosphatidyltransferase family protein [Planctomycetaceae bacterium]
MNTALRLTTTPGIASTPAGAPPRSARSASDYPLSRYCLKPLAASVAGALRESCIRPGHVTLLGALCQGGAALVLVTGMAPPFVAALWVLAAWFCDRLDGELARRQGTASNWGAWLDANLDELGDIGIHAAVAAAASMAVGAGWPWGLFLAFVAGKHLFMYGLASEERLPGRPAIAAASASAGPPGGLRALYHLPANADVRVHALMLALATNCLALELAAAALYYNLRWIVRYVLVARRLREGTR